MAPRKPARKGKQTQLPKGFEPISGFGLKWPPEKIKIGEMIVGVIIEFDEFEVQHKRKGKIETDVVQTLKLEAKDGTVYSLSESAGLRVLFEYEEGTEVAIIYDGMGRAKKGFNAPRLYRLAVR